MGFLRGRLLLSVTFLLTLARVYSQGNLLPFGEVHGDQMIRNVTDARLFEPLKTSISNLTCPFYGVAEDTLYIGANGVLSFRSQSSSLNPGFSYPLLRNPILATNRVLIAPYWARVNNNDIVERQIFYRYSINQTLLNEIGSSINVGFNESFSPAFLFIATWDGQRQRALASQQNTFQAVIATDGNKTFVLFLYQDIQWQLHWRTAIGFSAGDNMRFFNLPESIDVSKLTELENRSNVGRPGTFIFRVDQSTILEPPSQSVTLTVTAEAYVRMQEPDYQSSTPIEVCATAQIAQPLERLVVFDYRWTRLTTASNGRDFSLSVNQPFSISPGHTSLLNSCFNIVILGDDNIEIIDKQLVIIIEPVSALDRVNFTANNTITIIIEDNPSFLEERLLPFGEEHGDHVIRDAADERFSQPQHMMNISNLTFRFYGVEEEAVYVGLNGLLSFGYPSGSISPSIVPTPLSANPPLLTNHILVAPFWQSYSIGMAGRILYRYSDNQTLLDRVGSYITTAFDSTFSPGVLFIATWDRVRTYNVNTFQAIIATDGTKTFVLFLYGDIQAYSLTRTTMGFSAGDMIRSFTLPESRFNDRLYHLERSSNVGRSSTFIFRVDQHYITLSPGSNVTVLLNLDMSLTSNEMNVTEPDNGDLPTDVRICLTAQLDQPIDRLVAFEYYIADFSSATSNVDFFLRNRPVFFIRPGLSRISTCITVGIVGDDNPENDESATIIFEALSTLDHVNFGPNVTINIIDNDRLTEGVDYLEFIDLGAFDRGNNIVNVLPDSTEQLTNGDYFSDPIIVNTGIPIGARSQLTTVLYVLSDGAITFDRPIKLSTPLTFPLDFIQIAAPFLGDHATIAGTVRYKVYTGTTNQVTRRVSTFVRNRGFRNFVGNWMLVVEWRNLPMYPGSDPSTTNTYQAIIISNGRETFSVFTYNCNQLNWFGSANNYAAIGYNVLVTSNSAVQRYSNNPHSRLPSVGMVACSNVRFNIPWTNLVHRIGISISDFQNQRSRCLARVSRDEEIYPIPSDSLSDPVFLSDQVFARESLFASNSVFFMRAGIRDCPCTQMQAERDNRFGIARGRSFLGENICFFSRLSALYGGVSFGFRCCYSSVRGTLVTADTLGHGSILVLTSTGSTSSGSEYVENTLQFQTECCSVGLCDMFYSRRVLSTCSSYSFVIFTWAVGDPHISTLDGANYTFNGWGEYTLTQLGNFVFQGRTTAVNSSTSGSATQFSSFAFGVPNATVEVQVQNDGLHLLLNSEDITDTIPATNNTNTNSTLVYLQRSSEASILSLFSNGISITVTVSFDILSFVATIPEEYQGLPSGLLGNFNGDNSDDLMFANGTIVEIDSPYSLIHEFGQSWLINPADSLFTYPPGTSAADFSFPDHIPLSVDEVVAGATEEVRESCEGNIKCIFDATQTGNMEIGLNTMQTEEVNMEDRMIASNNPPNITGPVSFMVTLSQKSSFVISVVDTNLASFSITSGDVDAGVMNRDSADSSLYTFTWTPNAIIQDPIVFVATDDLGASSQYEPQITFCQCLNGAECTLQGVLNQMANPVDLTCLCAPGYEGRYCEEDIDGCRDFACLEGVECTDNPAPAEGATCGLCPQGFSGNSGRTCSEAATTDAATTTDAAVTTDAAATTTDVATTDVATTDAATTTDVATTDAATTMNVAVTKDVGTLDPQVVEDNLIRVTLYAIGFTEEHQLLFRIVTAQAINNYCISNPDQCTGLDGTKLMRQISNVLENNVFVINIRRNERNGVNFEMYITSLDNLLVLNQQALLEAVQTNADSYISAGFQPTFYVDSSESDHSSTEFFASIAAVIAALVLILILITLFVFCYWCKEHRDHKAAAPSDVYCNMDAGQEEEITTDSKEDDVSV